MVTGNPGRRAINAHEPVPLGVISDPPPWFTDEQRAEWAKVLADAPPGLLKPLDSGVLIIFCVAKAMHAEASQKIQQYGAVVKKTVNGQTVHGPSPYVRILEKAAMQMQRAAVEMGLTPSARSRVSVPPAESKSQTAFADLKDMGD